MGNNKEKKIWAKLGDLEKKIDDLKTEIIKSKRWSKIYVAILAGTLFFSAFVAYYDRFIYTPPEPEKLAISDVNISFHNATRINDTLESYTIIINNTELATGRDIELSIDFYKENMTIIKYLPYAKKPEYKPELYEGGIGFSNITLCWDYFKPRTNNTIILWVYAEEFTSEDINKVLYPKRIELLESGVLKFLYP